MLGIAAIVTTTAAGSGAAGQAASGTAATQFTIHKVATINVADLPAAGAGGAQGVVPFLTPDPAAFAAAKAGAYGAGSASVESIGGKKPKAIPGTQLPSAISSDDDLRYTPPDMGFAISGNGYKMEQINASGRIWDPNNTPGAVFRIENFYGAPGHFVFDPWIVFDQASKRWFAGAADGTSASQRLAVSTSETPTTFNVYNVPFGPPGGCPDQGKGGVSDNVFAISVNEFSNGCGGYLGVIITVLNKAELVAGAQTVHSAATPAMPQYFSLVPAQSMTATTTQWYASVNDSFSTTAHIAKTVGTPPAAVTFSEPFTPLIRTMTSPPNAQQKGTGALLDTGDNRVQTAAWQSNLLEFPEGESCIPNRDSTPRACARLLVVDTTSGAVAIDKTISKKGQYFFYPASRPNAAGTHAIGIGRSSLSIFPELDAVAVSPAGVAGKVSVLQTGDNGNSTGRYGDYFAIAIDPANTSNAWVAGEIGGHNSHGASRWATAVRQILVKP